LREKKAPWRGLLARFERKGKPSSKIPPQRKKGGDYRMARAADAFLIEALFCKNSTGRESSMIRHWGGKKQLLKVLIEKSSFAAVARKGRPSNPARKGCGGERLVPMNLVPSRMKR